MEFSPAAFRNQQMIQSAPRNPNGNIQLSYDPRELLDPIHSRASPMNLALSKESYKKPSDRRKNVGGMILDTELSGLRHAVYYSPQLNHVVYAAKGTDPSSSKDLIADGLLTANMYGSSRHYNDHKNNFRRAHEKYSGSTFSTTGHSLGSYVARTLARNHSSISSSTGFSGPGSFLDPLQNLTSHLYQTRSQRKLNKKHVEHVSNRDPVSIFVPRHSGRDIRYTKNWTFNPHSLDQYEGFYK